MKILLAGTPEFSVPIFEQIIKNFNVVAIVSQPDRPANRGYKLEATPTKKLAQKYQIPIFQPNKISEIKDQLKELDYDIMVSAAFGQWVPDSILNIAKVASVNIHGSLLPLYRGAAPIQHAILNGDNKTGITLIYMVKEMDAGNMLAKAEIDILEEDTSKEIFQKLSILASENIVQWLNDLYQNKLIEEKQDSSLVKLAPKIDKSFAQIFESDKIVDAYRKIKALNDNPGAFFINKENKRIKLYRASLNFVKNALILKLKDGILYVYEYQYEGKKIVNVK
ncbi:methionyl-tRNA formyltransferase [Mesomycoplasma lagogenitalium]|uniref:Methionyl-tRNA formyltransferase n=1 Tax=Mesomycoplasma lagogenitalium TaxID=171286 RepID=A0ABY8LTZ4_9BACT|nr:methionyl-tRNA formyltransferase [Mesomycoplasma lagogenitalium]WGI36714.1 methionyl-tRNA formyltransferase [Mesomycoplasma lagogenitalium]